MKSPRINRSDISQIGGANGYAEERWSSDPKFESQCKNIFFIFVLMKYDTESVILIYMPPTIFMKCMHTYAPKTTMKKQFLASLRV